MAPFLSCHQPHSLQEPPDDRGCSHPRRGGLTRAALVRFHRYAALGAGVLVVLVTLAGASLVFRDALTAWFTPRVVIAPRVAPPGAYQRMLDQARSLEPAAASLEIVPSAQVDRAAEVILKGPRGERHLFLDPYDAAVVADSEREWLPFATLFRLHKTLLAGERGEYAVAVAGLTLTFLAATGLFLWWPRQWKRALRVRWDGNRLAVSYDLHKAAGALFALFLLFNALTGIVLVFDDSAARVVNFIARSPPTGRIEMPPIAGTVKPLDELVAAADRAFPGGRVSRIVVREGAAVMVRKRAERDNDTHGMNRILVNPVTGAVLRTVALDGLPPGNAMFEWIYPLHTGNLLGTPYKAVLALAGLVPLLSLVTGLIVWRSRAAARRVAAREPVRASNTA